MIFLTVGAQMPFDRLVRAVDAWAARPGASRVMAQIGRSDYQPRHIEWTQFIDPLEFRDRLYDAELIVTHAGMGTILTALEFGRRMLVLPRRGDLQETRNDHQFGTARAFEEAGKLAVAWHESDLADLLDRRNSIPVPSRIASHASIELLTTLRDFIATGRVPTTDSAPLPALPLNTPDAFEQSQELSHRRAA